MIGCEVHGHSFVFLIRGESAVMLVDTGSLQDWSQVFVVFDLYLGERLLGYVFLMHFELLYVGNLFCLLDKYFDAVVIGDVRDYQVYYPIYVDRLRPCGFGAQFDLGGGMRFMVLSAVIRDLFNMLWGYESSRWVLFVLDGFLHTHHLELSEDEVLYLLGECG